MKNISEVFGCSNSTLTEAILNYRCVPSRENGLVLGECFYNLAKELIIAFDSLVPERDQNLTRRCAMWAFTRVDSFDPERGKAFNYFTTCMLNWLRGEWRAYKQRLELEERYGQYVIISSLAGVE